jgi:hypothetical protein
MSIVFAKSFKNIGRKSNIILVNSLGVNNIDSVHKLKTPNSRGLKWVGVDPASAGPTLPTFSRDALNQP